jgi:hypothetical protein
MNIEELIIIDFDDIGLLYVIVKDVGMMIE